MNQRGRKAKWLAAAMLLGLPAAAMAETAMYRCVLDGNRYDIKIEDGEWHERRPGTPYWKTKGCDDGTEKVRIECWTNDKVHMARTITSLPGGNTSVFIEGVDTETLLHTFRTDNDYPHTGTCAVLQDENAQPLEDWSLSRKLHSGMTFLFVGDKEGLKLFPGDWNFPDTRRVMIEGVYDVREGRWRARAVDFDPGGANPRISCHPTVFRPDSMPEGLERCEGHQMDRAYRPSDHELILFGQAYRFDDKGNVFAGERRVGTLVVPSL